MAKSRRLWVYPNIPLWGGGGGGVNNITCFTLFLNVGEGSRINRLKPKLLDIFIRPGVRWPPRSPETVD